MARLGIAGCLVGALTVAAGGCGAADAQKKSRKQEPSTMKLRSPAFEHQAEIPRKYTCEGEDLAPALLWEGAPAETESFALIVDDPDAPDPAAPKMTWVHWVLFNLPKLSASLPEGGKPLPPGTGEGLNDWKRTGYGGPCPPIGRHRYFHKLYALDATLELHKPTKAELVDAMAEHVIAEAVLMGSYEKRGK